MKITRRHHRRNDGFSLIEALAAVAFIGLGAVMLGDIHHKNLQALQVSKDRVELTAARTFVRNWLDCTKTMAQSATTCKTPGPINVLQSDGKVLVASNGKTLVGDHFVRATCNDGEISLDYQRARAVDGQKVKDEHAEWESLTNHIPLHCGFPMMITYKVVNYDNESAPRCLWMGDANNPSAPLVMLGCNIGGTKSWGVPATNTVPMTLSAGNKIRLIWNPATTTAPVLPAHMTWRSTDNLPIMKSRMRFTRTNKGNGTATIDGRIDDSNDNCNSNPWDFNDIWFTLDVPTQDFEIENMDQSC